MRGLLRASLALAAAGLAVAGSDRELRALEKDLPPARHLLYLPNGQYLRVASLGQASLAADLLYLWSIQFYGNFQIEDRYKYVEHIYTNVITELDPHYTDPYWLGALILSIETKSLDKALFLLDKGFAHNPDRWIFPYLAGWECAHAKQYERASIYFKKAAQVPGAPPDVARLVAGMFQKAGDAATALKEWTRLARDTRDPAIRKIAENRARALAIELDLGVVRAALERYRLSHGAWPRRLENLVEAGLLTTVPVDPDGTPYEYDRAEGRVGAGPPRVIPQ